MDTQDSSNHEEKKSGFSFAAWAAGQKKKPNGPTSGELPDLNVCD
jgi:hypothetical protein